MLNLYRNKLYCYTELRTKRECGFRTPFFNYRRGIKMKNFAIDTSLSEEQTRELIDEQLRMVGWAE